MKSNDELRYLEDRWDDTVARALDELELLRYRSNLLGSDLRITNFGGGNTSAKLSQPDPLEGGAQEVLWVKGSGGDLGSIQRQGFASLYLRKLHALRQRYRGSAFEDEMVELYSLCTFGRNPVATSIDTPLHGFLPFAHVDHLHPDWGIALAAAANGRQVLDELNERFGQRLIWIPWKRPGFELAMMMRNAVEAASGCNGIVLAGHGLFTWGNSSRECYRRSLLVIDQLGQLVLSRVAQKGGALFGGVRAAAAPNRQELAVDLLPFLRGRVCSKHRQVAHFNDAPEVLRFASSRDAEPLARLGTSCPDHFIRTKIRPLYVGWDASVPLAELRPRFEAALGRYREEYRSYYHANAQPGSPALRDDNPSVVLIPGLGMFTFGKTKSEARIVSEFYTNAIHVMEGATALGAGKPEAQLEGAGQGAFSVHDNYMALPLSEAFGIEYWQLEEAKLRRQPPEQELSRQIVVVVGAGSGIGRATALHAARRGAHVVVADLNLEQAEATAQLVHQHTGKEGALALSIDIRERASIRKALRAVVASYGGMDVLVNTAALFPSSASGQIDDATWTATLDINITSNYRLADEAAAILREQELEAAIILTSSANAVVAKRGSEAYDVSKAALSHLVRELATSLAPRIRVNGVSPATVVVGSSMFGRERVRASLEKYAIPFDPGASDEQLSSLLADFYARRALTRKAIHPDDCARAILFLAGAQAHCTTGHLLPVDGGLVDAFLR